MMEEEVDRPLRGRRRAVAAAKQPSNWHQLMRFLLVGAVGYGVNLAVYALSFQQLGFHYLISAVIAFVVAVTNNFWMNRHWTFKASEGHAGFQAARFFTVSTLALIVNLTVLKLLVSVVGVSELQAQAVAVICATPVNFIGHKLWSFG